MLSFLKKSTKICIKANNNQLRDLLFCPMVLHTTQFLGCVFSLGNGYGYCCSHQSWQVFHHLLTLDIMLTLSQNSDERVAFLIVLD